METIYDVQESEGEEENKKILLKGSAGFVFYSMRLHPEIVSLFNMLGIVHGEKVVVMENEAGVFVKRIKG